MEMEAKFTRFTSTPKGSRSVSECGLYSVQLFKRETGQLTAILNSEDSSLGKPQIITLTERSPKGEEFGSTRHTKQSNAEYIFLRGAKKMSNGNYAVYRGNLYTAGAPMLQVRVEEQEPVAESEATESEATESEAEANVDVV